MPDKVIHEIRLNQYSAVPADRTRRFSLGTRDSYGVEQLRIVPGEGWDGLTITATFHPPEGEAVQVLIPDDGLIDVPPEATRSGSELPIRYGKIVFAGVADGVQRISCNLPYTVMEHAPVDGAASSGPSPSWYEQAAAHFVPSGGKAGQVLAKASDTDLDVEWADGGTGTAGVEVDATLTQSGQAADAAAVGERLSSLSEENAELKGDLNELKEQGIGGGSGIPQAQKTNLAKAIRQELAFASTSHPFIDAFLAWLESGSDTPVTPPEDEPTAPTLTGITVTWSAESADVGTDPKTLITSVKAVYSDGSQQTATGYSVTPSALVEGDNNVVVSYGGMSETKSITGIVPEVDVIVYRPAEDCPDGWNVVTIDGDTDISIPIFNNNPSGENGVTFAEFNITDICSYGNTSVNNIKMPSQFMFKNNLNDVNLKGVSNVCCAVFWQNKRYLQFGLSSSDCGTTVESIKQYLARYNYVFYVR